MKRQKPQGVTVGLAGRAGLTTSGGAIMGKKQEGAQRGGNSDRQAAAQEESPQQQAHEPEAANPLTAGNEDLVAADYEVLSREPLTISIPPGLMAQGMPATLTPEQEAARERKIQQAVEKILEEEKAGICHAVHPGWVAAFRWGLEYADKMDAEERAAQGAGEAPGGSAHA